MKIESTGEEAIKAVEKALGTPFGLEYQDHVLKTRRNLLIAGAVAMVFYLAGLKIEAPTPTAYPTIPLIFGLAVSGLSQKAFLISLLCLLGYLLGHFIWASIDAIFEFRLRSTGTNLAHKTNTWGEPHSDHPREGSRQSTLYTWWLDKSSKLPNQAEFEQAAITLQELTVAVRSASVEGKMPAHGLFDLTNAVEKSADALSKLQQHLKYQNELVVNPRIEASLRRFDNAFRNHALSQNLRWLIFDFGAPVMLGITGFVMIAIKLCNS
jgi:hypothetical protein